MNYYLSEMNVSAKHGGGLTLMRILGENLELFDGFIRIDSYDERFESHPSTVEREINLWKEPGAFVIKAMPRRFTKDYFINQTKRILGVPNTRYIEEDYVRKEYTRYLGDRIDIPNSHFLVVPQRHYSVYYTNHLYKKYNIRYATWVMDDHVVGFNGEKGRYEYPPKFEQEFAVHLRNARHVFVISENMGEFYKERFGVDYSVLFSPTDPVEMEKDNPADNNRLLRLCHFGRIWKWPLDAAEKFANRLEELNAELDVYSFYELEGPLKHNNRVKVKTPVSGNEVLDKMQEYDAVTIFYGYDSEVRHFTELNISTKMSECLASGLPTLFVGPEYAAMTRFARTHGCGIVITDLSDDQTLSVIDQLRHGKSKHQVIENQLSVARTFTSTNAMKNIWKEGWNKVVAIR